MSLDSLTVLRKVPAAVRFLSCELLIGFLTKLHLKGIDWVIVGGESGAKPRPMKPEWATSIRDQCDKLDVAFFFKQRGGRNKKAAGRELDGTLHDTFRAFSQAGRDLARWHLDYETVEMHDAVLLETPEGEQTMAAVCNRPANTNEGAGRLQSAATFRVTKMKFGRTKDANSKSVNDKSTVIYNDFITLKDIPLEAYEYVVNGKPALEWVMERQSVTTDKDSGIANDANLWATETMGDPKYPLGLFLHVITVSLETMKIVKVLPELEIP